MLQVLLVTQPAVYYAGVLGMQAFFHFIMITGTSCGRESRFGPLLHWLFIIMRSKIIEYIHLLVIVFPIYVEAQLLLNRLGSSVVNRMISLPNCIVNLSCDLVIQLGDISQVAVHL